MVYSSAGMDTATTGDSLTRCNTRSSSPPDHIDLTPGEKGSRPHPSRMDSKAGVPASTRSGEQACFVERQRPPDGAEPVITEIGEAIAHERDRRAPTGGCS
jgi:hypothetical protein